MRNNLPRVSKLIGQNQDLDVGGRFHDGIISSANSFHSNKSYVLSLSPISKSEN